MPVVAESLRDLQGRAAERARNTPPPECYRWRAVWWHLESRESANPSDAIRYARNQLRLAHDMEARPGHYADLRRRDETDWQWSGLEPVE